MMDCTVFACGNNDFEQLGLADYALRVVSGHVFFSKDFGLDKEIQ